MGDFFFKKKDRTKEKQNKQIKMTIVLLWI